MNILVKAVAGSHLFGLNTEKSDKDFKGVYMPTLEELLLGDEKKSISVSTNPTNNKNSSEDVDTEFYSLSKFFKMLEEGQTVAYELLFTPLDKQIQTSEVWQAIQKEAHKLVHRNCLAFIGYAKTQADRYGLRGSRMGTVENVLVYLKEYIEDIYGADTMQYDSIMNIYNPKERLDEFLVFNKRLMVNLEHVEFIDKYRDGRQYISVCSKKFDLRTKVSDVISSLQKTYDEYGERSRQAKLNEGIDWKALSHAVRVMYQGQELLDTGRLSFPFVGEKHRTLMDVKQGKLDYSSVVQPLIETEMDKLKVSEKKSQLPEKLNTKQMLLNIYKQYYNLTN